MRSTWRRFRRTMWARENWQGFRLGYITALHDLERTGLHPKTDKRKRECAERALQRLVEDSSDAR